MHVKRHPISILVYAYKTLTKKIPLNEETSKSTLNNFMRDCCMIYCSVACVGGHVGYVMQPQSIWIDWLINLFLVFKIAKIMIIFGVMKSHMDGLPYFHPTWTHSSIFHICYYRCSMRYNPKKVMQSLVSYVLNQNSTR